MQEWRSTLQSKLMRNIVVSAIALDAAGVLMTHYKMSRPVDVELMVDEASIVAADTSDSSFSDARVRPEPVADREIVMVMPEPVPNFAFYPQAEANSQAPLVDEIERNADAAAREHRAATHPVKVADLRPRTRIKPAARATPKVQRDTMNFSRAFPAPDNTSDALSAAVSADTIDQLIMSDASLAPGLTEPTIVEGYVEDYEDTPETTQGFEAQPDATFAPEAQTAAPSSGAAVPEMSELPPVESAAEPASSSPSRAMTLSEPTAQTMHLATPSSLRISVAGLSPFNGALYEE